MTITLSTAVQGSLYRPCTLTGMSIERRFIGSATFGVGLWFLDVVAEAAQFAGLYRLKRSRLRRFGEGLERLAKEQWSGFWLRALPARSQPTRRWSVPMVIVTANAMRCSISLAGSSAAGGLSFDHSGLLAPLHADASSQQTSQPPREDACNSPALL